MVTARTRLIVSFVLIAVIALPALLLGAFGGWNYPVFYDLKPAFAICLTGVALLGIALLLLCRGGRRSTIFAVLFTIVWVLVLLPDTQYYLGTRGATENSIVEPFYRQQQLLGYLLVLLPVPFVLCGLWLRHRQPSNQAMQRTAGRSAF